LTTLINSRALDGSAFTLCEIVPLLVQPAFRRFVIERAALPDSLKGYWQWYDGLSDRERAQSIGPLINKVEAFTSRTAIRLLLGQSAGIDLRDVFRERRALLVSLAKGALGSETANLLGSLLVSCLWNVTLERVHVPAEKRSPVFAHIDEAQDLVRLPLAMADMLAQARGLKLGITLANQYVAQLPESVRAAVLGTVRTQIAFGLEWEDARLLERRFAPLTVDDLRGLDAFEIAMRPCVGGITLSPVTGTTLPPGPVTRDGAALAETSRKRYGAPRTSVEAALRARLETGRTAGTRFGREQPGDRA
jgi:hypothetical protein